MNLETIKSDMQKLGEEVFISHEEEVFQALSAICLCKNLVRDREIWKRTDDLWGMAGTDTELRMESFQELNRVLGNPKEWTEEEIPLRNFLISGVRLMTDMYDWTKEKEAWLGWMSGQILVNRYSGARLFQEYIYLLGLMKIREGSSSRQLLETFRFAVPAGEQKAYDRSCRAIERKLRKKRNAYMRETTAQRFDRWIKMVKESESARVVSLFNEKYRKMPKNSFCEWVESRLSEAVDLEYFREAGYGIDEMKQEELKSFLSENKERELSRLAELFVYAEWDVRSRLLEQLSDEEQETVLERWMLYFYPAFRSDLTGRMNRIAEHAGESGVDERGRMEPVCGTAQREVERICGNQKRN